MPSDWQDSVAAHKARYRERIITAAMELIGEQGFTGLTMVKLAQRAGVGRATLYKYFPDIEHVLLAYVETEVDRYADELRSELGRHDDPFEQLRVYVSKLLHYFAAERHRVGASSLEGAGLSAHAEAALGRHLAKLLDPLVALLDHGVRRGAFQAGTEPPLHAQMVFAALGALRDDLVAERLTPQAAIELASAFVMRGLAAPGK